MSLLDHLMFLTPCALGLLAILWPVRQYTHSRAGGYLTMLILHGVIGGFGVLSWGATVIMDGYPTLIPLIAIALCVLVAGIDVVRFKLISPNEKRN